MQDGTVIEGDVLEALAKKAVEHGSVDCIVTSPPYWGLRDYGHPKAWGLEPSIKEYVRRMKDLAHELKRVLSPTGTCWLNLGDAYLDKQQVGIPWRVAFAWQDAGWTLRADIVWSKPNPMPESVTDRPSRSHETVFLFAKSAKYWYDHEAVRTVGAKGPEQMLIEQPETQAQRGVHRPRRTDKQRGHSRRHGGFDDRWDAMTKAEQSAHGANLRTVWEFATCPYLEAHFATFPPELPKRCILAGCPEGRLVLDPFAGSGTTLAVARSLGRRSVGIEVNPEYAAMARKRFADAQPTLTEVTA